jgi:hypothetical protein
MDNTCIGIKANGSRCTFKGKVQTVEANGTNVRRCATHERMHQEETERMRQRQEAAGPITEGLCPWWRTWGVRCNSPIVEGICTACTIRARVVALREETQVAVLAQRRAEREEAEVRMAAFVDRHVAIGVGANLPWREQAGLWYHQYMTNPRQMMEIMGLRNIMLAYGRIRRPGLAMVEVDTQIRRLHEAAHLIRMEGIAARVAGIPRGIRPVGVPEPEAPVRRANNLGAIATDAQSVHTRAVAKQTNEGVAKLLAEVVPESQQTMMEIWNMWTCSSKQRHNPRLALMLFGDMLKWYETPTCKTKNDFLYKRLIDGLWARVQRTEDKELRAELRLRVAQEVVESKDMCCEGHISRLVNVLVGFDDAFKPPVPVGEILQQKMALIAGKDIETEAKQTEARSVFAELGIPEAEQAAWLEAF